MNSVDNLKFLMELLSSGTLFWLAKKNTDADLRTACIELLKDRADVKRLKRQEAE